MTTHRTIPQIGVELNVATEICRKVLKKHPELRALGVQVGAARVYGPDAVALIRAAVLEHVAKFARRTESTSC